MRTLAIACAFVLFSSGCATLFSGTDEEITFNSSPSGAEVVVDGIIVGTTPTTVEIDRPGLEDQDVTIELDGYETRTFELDKEFNTTSILNIFFWPGFVVDALTGALFRYDKDTYSVNLETGAISLRLDELERGMSGEYLLPNVDEPVEVVDARTGLKVVFN